MYKTYWGLEEKPFENIADSKFFYWSSQHEEAFARLYYAVNERKGAAMLSGIFGCGKTMIATSLFEKFGGGADRKIFLTIPPRTFPDLLRAIVRNLKTINLPTGQLELSSDALLEMLEGIFRDNMREGRHTVIIVDEAHSIADEVLEGLRLLLNFQTKQGFQLTLLLLGQSELEGKIENNKPFEQRVSMKAHLKPLTFEETQGYILHRLKIAGTDQKLFTNQAMELIHQNTGGIPRRINRLCDISLLAGFSKKSKQIDRDMIEEETQAMSL